MKTIHSVRFDIGLYTNDESVGQIVGNMDLDFLPHLKDEFNFDLHNPNKENSNFSEDYIILTVEKRFFHLLEGKITKMITFSDCIMKNIEECREIGFLMQELHGFTFDEFINSV